MAVAGAAMELRRRIRSRHHHSRAPAVRHTRWGSQLHLVSPDRRSTITGLPLTDAGENPLAHRDVRRVRRHLVATNKQRCLPVGALAACWMDLSSIFA